MTPITYHMVSGTIALALALSAVGWFMVRCLKRSEDPPRLIFKWVLTAGVIGCVIWYVGPMVAGGGAIVGMMSTLLLAIFMTIVWRHNIRSEEHTSELQSP